MEFTTHDNDNDAYDSGNCASSYSGGNWWDDCGQQNINGIYGGNGDIGGKYIMWYHFNNDRMALKSMTLMLRQAV